LKINLGFTFSSSTLQKFPSFSNRHRFDFPREAKTKYKIINNQVKYKLYSSWLYASKFNRSESDQAVSLSREDFDFSFPTPSSPHPFDFYSALMGIEPPKVLQSPDFCQGKKRDSRLKQQENSTISSSSTWTRNSWIFLATSSVSFLFVFIER